MQTLLMVKFTLMQQCCKYIINYWFPFLFLTKVESPISELTNFAFTQSPYINNNPNDIPHNPINHSPSLK